VLRVMSFLAIALIAEMIFFGPLGLTVYDVSIRKTLILVLVACSIVPMLMQHRIVTWQIFFLLFTILFVVIWGGIVPLTNGVDLKMSMAEIQPLIGLLLILPLYYLFQHDGPELYLNAIKLCAFVMASVVIFVWAATNIFGSFSTGMALRDFYIGLNDNLTGVYIGPLPDGTFRVMLINFIIFGDVRNWHSRVLARRGAHYRRVAFEKQTDHRHYYRSGYFRIGGRVREQPAGPQSI
jgi:hypothetical protein